MGMEVNKVICGDCLEVLKTFDNECIDLTVTSPPYNFNAGSGLGTKYKNEIKDNLTQLGYFEWQKNCLEQIIRVSKLTFYNIQFIAGNREALCMLIGYFSKDIKEIMIWNKIFSEPAINDGVLNSQFEFIIVFEKIQTEGNLINVILIKEH